MPEMGVEKVARIRVMTTTERDALEAVEGMIIFNSTTDQLEEYDGAVWQAVGQVIMDTHIADLDAHVKDEFEILRTGEYHTGRNLGGNALALTADRLYANLLVVARDMTVDRIAISVQALDAGTTARLGIYQVGTNLHPGALLLDADTVTTAATGVKAATISQALVKGIYYLAFVSDGTPSLWGRSVPDVKSPLGVVANFTSGTQNSWYADDPAPSAYHTALPDPFPTATLNGKECAIAVRVASLD